jgi:hypothetical protein
LSTLRTRVQFMNGGNTILYTHIDNLNQLYKLSRSWDEHKPALQIERRILKRFEEHPNFVKVIEMNG